MGSWDSSRRCAACLTSSHISHFSLAAALLLNVHSAHTHAPGVCFCIFLRAAFERALESADTKLNDEAAAADEEAGAAAGAAPFICEVDEG